MAKSYELFTLGAARDKIFEFNRDEPTREWFREKVEAAWQVYKPYCPDAHFHMEFRNDFWARLWEIQVANALICNGHILVKGKPKGPDLCIDEAPRIWVECIAAKSGQGASAVNEIPLDQPVTYSDNNPILRFTAAIAEKARKVSGYISSGDIDTHDPAIIAITSAAFYGSFWDVDPAVPAIVKAVFPLGSPIYHVPVMGGMGPITKSYEILDHRTNSNGAPITTKPFLSTDIDHISGILFCNPSIFHSQEPYGRDFIFVHNFYARNPVKQGFFKFGREFWAGKKENGRFELQRSI